MKLNGLIVAGVLLCTFALLASDVHAVVVADTNVELGPGAPEGDFALTVFQDAAGTDPTTLWFDVSGSSLVLVNFNIDEGADAYLTLAGNDFTAATIGSGSFTPFSLNNPVSVGFGAPFFVGVNTGLGFPDDRDVFGWAELQLLGPDLMLLDSAMAYGERGIRIGTETAIPEPSPTLLGFLSLVAFLLGRRRRA